MTKRPSKFENRITLRMSVTKNSTKKNKKTGANGTMIVIKINDPFLQSFATLWADHDENVVILSVVPRPGMKPVTVQDDDKINISTRYDLKLFDRREVEFFLDSNGNYFGRHDGRAERDKCPTCGRVLESVA